jgi:hypothetical protein
MAPEWQVLQGGQSAAVLPAQHERCSLSRSMGMETMFART